MSSCVKKTQQLLGRVCVPACTVHKFQNTRITRNFKIFEPKLSRKWDPKTHFFRHGLEFRKKSGSRAQNFEI